MEKKYSISDAAKQVEVETHVLRYWEEELGLHIERNAQGHRLYRTQDIALLRDIKGLKEQGFVLKAIKMVLPDIQRVCRMDTRRLYHLREELNEQVLEENNRTTARVMPLRPKQDTALSYREDSNDAEERLRHFEAMMRKMIRTTVEEMENESEERICEKITSKILKEMDYLTRQKEELQEKQMKLLQQILEQVGGRMPESAASAEQITQLKSRRPKREARKRKKIFAKSVQ